MRPWVTSTGTLRPAFRSISNGTANFTAGPKHAGLCGAVVVDPGQLSADPVGVGPAEIGVDSQRLLVVHAGAGPVAERTVRVAEAGMGAGLLVAVTGVGGDGESEAVLGTGLAGLAGGGGGGAGGDGRPPLPPPGGPAQPPGRAPCPPPPAGTSGGAPPCPASPTAAD